MKTDDPTRRELNCASALMTSPATLLCVEKEASPLLSFLMLMGSFLDARLPGSTGRKTWSMDSRRTLGILTERREVVDKRCCGAWNFDNAAPSCRQKHPCKYHTTDHTGTIDTRPHWEETTTQRTERRTQRKRELPVLKVFSVVEVNSINHCEMFVKSSNEPS